MAAETLSPLQQATEEVRRIFHAELFEFCLACVHCRFASPDWLVPRFGTLYVCRTALYFAPSIDIELAGRQWTAGKQVVAYKAVASVEYVRSSLLGPAMMRARLVQSADGERTREITIRRTTTSLNETFHVLSHFWRAIKEPDSFAHRRLSDSSSVSKVLLTGGCLVQGDQRSPAVERSRIDRIVALVLESEDIGLATLAQLDAQTDQMMRIRSDLERVGANVQTARKILKSMSIWGTVVALFDSGAQPTRDLSAASSESASSAMHAPQRAFLNCTAISVLAPSAERAGAMTQQFLYFANQADGVALGNIGDDGSGPVQALCRYSELRTITVLASRPFGLELALEGERVIVLVSAYVEDIVLELQESAVAHGRGVVHVILEPNAVPFSHQPIVYQSAIVSVGSGTEATGMFKRRARTAAPAASAAPSALANPAYVPLPVKVFADADAAQQLATVQAEEAAFAELSAGLTRLHSLAQAMGRTLDQQNGLLDELHERTDQTTADVQAATRQVVAKTASASVCVLS